MAGLNAARWLHDHGHAGNVVVIEGSDRIGGRIRTDRTLSAPVELGAQWIHGAGKANPVAKLARKLRLATSRTDYDSLEVLAAAGGAIAAKDLARAERQYKSVVRDLKRRKNRTDRDESVATALAAIDAGAGLGAGERALLELLYFWNIASEYAAPLDELSLWRWDEDAAYGGRDVVLPDGYAAIPEHLAADLDIRLGQAVTAVDTTGGRVRVKTRARRDGRVARYTARAVIVTVPLGVLHAEAIRFTPTLPEDFRASLATLGFGAGLKLALEFPAAAWPEQPDFLLQSGAEGSDSLLFSNLLVHGDAPVLVMEAYLGAATRLENQSLGATVDEAVARLRKSFPDLAEPTAVARSGWNNSTLAGGAYSFWGVGSTRRDIDRLREPVNGRLVFAGEHTSARYPGTVHGAHGEGERAARQAGDLLN